MGSSPLIVFQLYLILGINGLQTTGSHVIKADPIYDQIVSLLQCVIKTSDNENELYIVNINIHKLLCCTCLYNAIYFLYNVGLRF